MIVKQNWQLQTPINAIIFDCDGTLSTIEGIDELAENNGVSTIVKSLTADAMGKSGINPELYQKRLDLVQPSHEQVRTLGQQYFTHQVPDVDNVIQIFKRLNKTVYLVSAGLYPAVSIFGELLKIPQKNIYAVDIHFDSQGNYLSYEKTSPLVYNDGKRKIVTQLKSLHQDIIYVGDGLNDYSTYDLVTRFVGFGGAFYRENIASRCQYYIHELTMAPLLPLSLTQKEYENLDTEEQSLYHKGLTQIAHR